MIKLKKNNKMVILVSKAIFFFALLMTGCVNNVELNSDLFPKSFFVYEYEKGKIVYEASIDSNDIFYRGMQAWYFKNLNNWNCDINSYAPSLLLFSDAFKVNIIFKSKIIIINYIESGEKWKQVAKHISDEDINSLKTALFERKTQ